jgi:hypothetical protein
MKVDWNFHKEFSGFAGCRRRNNGGKEFMWSEPAAAVSVFSFADFFWVFGLSNILRRFDKEWGSEEPFEGRSWGSDGGGRVG